MVVDLKKFYQCLAIFVRVQALQKKPTESQPQEQPQRASLNEAKQYFTENYEVAAPGINLIEIIRANVQITVEDEK